MGGTITILFGVLLIITTITIAGLITDLTDMVVTTIITEIIITTEITITILEDLPITTADAVVFIRDAQVI